MSEPTTGPNPDDQASDGQDPDGQASGDQESAHPRDTRFRLLASVPDLGDENFDQTVVLVLDHDDEGALGVVLNRPSATTVEEHLPQVAELAVSPPVFFVGGPVSVGGLLAIGRRSIDAELHNVIAMDGALAMVDPEALINEDVSGVDAVRLFTGYSGWAPGQLDAEIAAGTWHVLSALPDDVLCLEPESLWRSVMRRQGGRLASQSLYPDDLSVN